MTLNVDKVTKNRAKSHTKKRAKNGRFFQNARLNGHARFKTGDFSTLVQYFTKLPVYSTQQYLTSALIVKVRVPVVLTKGGVNEGVWRNITGTHTEVN